MVGRNESLIEMTGVRKELKLIAMEAVAVVGEEMKQCYGGGDGDEDGEVGLGAAAGEGLTCKGLSGAIADKAVLLRIRTSCPVYAGTISVVPLLGA